MLVTEVNNGVEAARLAWAPERRRGTLRGLTRQPLRSLGDKLACPDPALPAHCFFSARPSSSRTIFFTCKPSRPLLLANKGHSSLANIPYSPIRGQASARTSALIAAFSLGALQLLGDTQIRQHKPHKRVIMQLTNDCR